MGCEWLSHMMVCFYDTRSMNEKLNHNPKGACWMGGCDLYSLWSCAIDEQPEAPYKMLEQMLIIYMDAFYARFTPSTTPPGILQHVQFVLILIHLSAQEWVRQCLFRTDTLVWVKLETSFEETNSHSFFV
jgi:hypothetical protein